MPDAAFATVKLRDGHSSLEATFVPGAGMLCCSLTEGGDQLLAQRAGLEAYVKRGKTMGIPLLYPWANRLAGFVYTVEGRSVELPNDPALIGLDGAGLPMHGVIGGRIPWEMHDAPGSGRASLAASLVWDESLAGLFEVFPFRHDIGYVASLAEDSLTIELTVDACGADVVPITFGFHPYLAPGGPPRERWLLELPAMRRLALDARQIPTGRAEDCAAQRFGLGERVFDDPFDSIASPACFAVQAGGRRIGLEFRQGFTCAQLFAPASARFVCFEPMTAPPNALRSGRGLRLLAPGNRYTASFCIRIRSVA